MVFATRRSRLQPEQSRGRHRAGSRARPGGGGSALTRTYGHAEGYEQWVVEYPTQPIPVITASMLAGDPATDPTGFPATLHNGELDTP